MPIRKSGPQAPDETEYFLSGQIFVSANLFLRTLNFQLVMGILVCKLLRTLSSTLRLQDGLSGSFLVLSMVYAHSVGLDPAYTM